MILWINTFQVGYFIADESNRVLAKFISISHLTARNKSPHTNALVGILTMQIQTRWTNASDFWESKIIFIVLSTLGFLNFAIIDIWVGWFSVVGRLSFALSWLATFLAPSHRIPPEHCDDNFSEYCQMSHRWQNLPQHSKTVNNSLG